MINYLSVKNNYLGKGSLGSLPDIITANRFKRALIITDDFLYHNGTVEKVAEQIACAGVEFGVFKDILPNPTVETVCNCCNYAKAIQADFFVAVGGGSPIDTAKAAGILLTNGGNVESYEGTNLSKYPSTPLVVVNTTAGSGSEATVFYIITDTKRNSKMCMIDKNCLPIATVNDSDLMLSMPPSLTAATGLDALTHAIESVLSKESNMLSEKDAFWAMGIIVNNIHKAYSNGNDEVARENMAIAANIAGIAFTNSGLGAVHAISHALGGFYNLPHGICNAILLPYVLELYAKRMNVDSKFINIAGCLNCADKGDIISGIANKIRQISGSMQVPTGFKSYSIVKPSAFPSIANLALIDVTMPSSPIAITMKDVIMILNNAYR